jgi:virginiamycin B lyase
MRLLPVALLALATPALAQQSATLPTFPITEWETPWDPKDLIRDPIADDQGRIWFCGMLGNFIGLFEPGTGKFKRYELPAGTIPHNVIVDRQGRAWLSGNRNGTINRIDPASGVVTPYKLPRASPIRTRWRSIRATTSGSRWRAATRSASWTRSPA